jgi:2-oxo-4-hydroxy-4-carboxy-5-ureidoimidazoline decarboxylase
MATVEELNALDRNGFASAVAPLFEGGPRFLARLAEARPFESEEDLFGAARATARQMPEEEQIELLDAHPRIGADPSTVSVMSHAEQGYDAPTDDRHAWVADELTALNEAYESLFGFRFVVFVAGRPRIDIIPIIERAVHAERDEELRRGLDDVVLIAADRWQNLRGPRPLPEEVRESIALELSRYLVGELDRDGLIRATHRLIEQDVESPALLALSLSGDDPDVAAPIRRLFAEIGLPDWEASQAGQLLALHAAASIIGEVSQPIDGARRIASVSGNQQFRVLVTRWEAEEERRPELDDEIRRSAAQLFGPPVPPEEAA